MKVIEMIENEDGSFTMTVDVPEEETRFLVEAGMNSILKDYLENFEDKFKGVQ